ncbi:MAG TPA: isochorismate synthase [Acidimicrobiales bacterium]|nr:isochorismate synthase [Acidimicrobiales bacterium]
MKFVRRQVDTVSPDALRTIGARHGWLVESPDTLRVGFGPTALEVDLPGGTSGRMNVAQAFTGLTLEGAKGPAGTGVVAFGTLPFDPTAPGRLDIPIILVTQQRGGETWVTCAEAAPPWRELLDSESLPTQEPQSLRTLTYQPTAEEYAHNVALAVEVMRAKKIDKVVLARAVLGTVPEPLDCAAIAERLRRREPICTIYSLPTFDGRRFVGASPELIVRREGTLVRSQPLAGTISLPPHAAPDDYHTWLLGSAKNLHEHAVVVDDIVQLLSRDYDDIVADPTPSIVALRTVAHLGSWITGVHADPTTAPDALEVLRLLHPTAAVGGMPRDAAVELLAALEQHDRGHYAGPVGWVDQQGDGEWWLGLRGVLVDGTAFEAWAGAGIVSESDPIAEREETRDKLASVLTSVLVDRV